MTLIRPLSAGNAVPFSFSRASLSFLPRTVPASSHIPSTRRTVTTLAVAPHNIPSDVFVLDFDGVLADSQVEVSSAGLMAAKSRWPDVFKVLDKTSEKAVLGGLAATRPRLVKGYESMIMARLIQENSSNIIQEILKPTWDAPGGLLQTTLAAWGENEASLIALFESLRGDRVANNPDAWIQLNPLYSGIKDALADCPFPFYLCSSKRGDRLVRLLNALLDLDLDEASPRVMSGLIPPNEMKIEALKMVASRPIATDSSTTLHFVDDRFETIAAVAAEPHLRSRYKLYLADWGYNTADERKEAQGMENVRVITLPQFCELLRFGIIMEVDDGCQDTEEEALNAIYKPYASGGTG